MPRSSPPPSNTAPSAANEREADLHAASSSSTAAAGAAEAQRSIARPTARPHSLRHRVTRKLAAPIRWLHIYLSMFGLAAVLFFSATGLTLNHPEWFAEAERRDIVHGEMDKKWLRADAPSSGAADDEAARIARFEVAEFLRKTHHVRGEVSELRADEGECSIAFKGPGYAADAVINRASGHYELTQTSFGAVAVLNDLHKGRDTGKRWAIVIDVSAYLLIVISVSGVALLLYIKRRRISGIAIAVIGTAIIAAIALFLVR